MRAAARSPLRCGGLAADGRLVWESELEMPFAAMVHEFAVTDRFVVIPLLPLAGSLERVEHGRPDPAEGDGWLLALRWWLARERRDLVAFDAQALADGPVTTARLPCRVPAGFHGNRVERAVLEGGQAA